VIEASLELTRRPRLDPQGIDQAPDLAGAVVAMEWVSWCGGTRTSAPHAHSRGWSGRIIRPGQPEAPPLGEGTYHVGLQAPAEPVTGLRQAALRRASYHGECEPAVEQERHDRPTNQL